MGPCGIPTPGDFTTMFQGVCVSPTEANTSGAVTLAIGNFQISAQGGLGMAGTPPSPPNPPGAVSGFIWEATVAVGGTGIPPAGFATGAGIWPVDGAFGNCDGAGALGRMVFGGGGGPVRVACPPASSEGLKPMMATTTTNSSTK